MTGKDGGGNGTGLQSHGIENGKHNGERTASEAGQVVDCGGFFRYVDKRVCEVFHNICLSVDSVIRHYCNQFLFFWQAGHRFC